jgi:hypothetical protein
MRTLDVLAALQVSFLSVTRNAPNAEVDDQTSN